jgi:hypothetical protein
MKFFISLFLFPIELFARYNESEWRDDVEASSQSSDDTFFNIIILLILYVVPFIIWNNLKKETQENLKAVGLIIFAIILYTGIAISIYQCFSK